MNAPREKQRPAYWEAACTHLARQDRALVGLIQAYPGESLTGGGDPFLTLANAIVGQQISVKAAEAIWGRLTGLTGRFAPDTLLAQPPETLRAAGLSLRKIEYLHDLARHVLDGKLDPADLARLDDAAVTVRLTDIRGIGRWTAEMFLIFDLMRPNVLPIDDIGLQRAVARHYGWDYPFPPARLVPFAERWQPYRTVATWYLWRSLDPVTVAY